MSVRALLLLVLLCAPLAVMAGHLAHARWGDEPPAPGAAPDAEAARAAYERLLAMPTGPERERARRAFLSAHPESWLHAVLVEAR